LQILSLRRLQTHRQPPEAPVVQDQPERLDAELSLADVVVAVDARAQLFLRIVQMERREALDADELVEFLEHRRVALLGAEIVAGGERVLGVEADAEPFALLGRVDDVADLLEAVAETASLSGGDLERDFRLEAA